MKSKTARTSRERTSGNKRARDLAASVEQLKQEIEQRKAVEESLRASEEKARRLLEKSSQMQAELRLLSHQLISAQEDERRKISRELHDVIAQTLAGIDVRLAALKGSPTISARELHKNISRTQILVERSMRIVHRFALNLRPPVLDDLGLIPALRSFMKNFLKDTGVRVSLRVFAEIESIPLTTRTALYRVALEALTNVGCHAQASHAEVSIQRQDHGVRMDITDDGRGFVMEATPSARKGPRLGLLGMRERIEMVGGIFSITSAPGSATRVRVEVPASKKPARKAAPQPILPAS